MIITVYRKDQGSHTTMWKEHARYDEEEKSNISYLAKIEEGFVKILRFTKIIYTTSEGEEDYYCEESVIFVGGGENFYYTRSEK